MTKKNVKKGSHASNLPGVGLLALPPMFQFPVWTTADLSNWIGLADQRAHRLLSGMTIILETAVGREKAVQAIRVHREFEKLVVTLLVMRGFSNSLGA